MEKKKKTVTQTRIVTFTVSERVCPQCGKTFEGWGKKKFCSKLCSNKAAWDRHANEYKAARRAKYHEKKT